MKIKTKVIHKTLFRLLYLIYKQNLLWLLVIALHYKLLPLELNSSKGMCYPERGVHFL